MNPHISMPSMTSMWGFLIYTYEMTMGDLPVQAQRLVKEWLQTNGPALIEMWNTQIIKQLPPLK